MYIYHDMPGKFHLVCVKLSAVNVYPFLHCWKVDKTCPAIIGWRLETDLLLPSYSQVQKLWLDIVVWESKGHS